ncbi:hypothetical protein EVAR_2817_1 [Eumeta japonica]|uniref:RRM domain-containing protein n=1 Tax=Eumeta variegata TaxID=151549 RepID=A0A4C1T2E0_EUMVA|nr:hypothetical protein EVAR_2817_1 [Eumeta japonica]
MFFNENVAGIFYPDLLQVVHREISTNNVYGDHFTISTPNIPTHTEDGIPIRKLYVTNLPPKTTRTELFGVFAQYGYIRSCWLRMGEKGPNKTPSATYGFVTFSNPSDAYRALQAPGHEKMLYGRVLRISPADSWHQPVEDSTGRVIWSNYTNKRAEALTDDGIRTYKTSWWQHDSVVMTTAVLRRLLQRLGSLTRLHVDHHWSALNDRTAHTIGKFCPMLEELKVTDSNLVHLVKNDSCIEYLTVANNSNLTGLFLTGVTPPQLNTLAFYNCFSLQGTVLSAAADTLTNLKVLKLDACPLSLWKIIPNILKKLPKLEELSLSGYTSIEGIFVPPTCDSLCEALSSANKLKTVNFSKNIYITNAVIKQLAKSCPKLESLNVAACNTRKSFAQSGYITGINDEAVAAVCRACANLRHLDVSYLAALTEAGVAAAAQCQLLITLRVRGNRTLTAQPFITCLQACHFLEELDVCGCDNISEALVEEALNEIQVHPRHLLLRIGGTLATQIYQTHKICREVEVASGDRLRLNVDDLCSTPLRPDFVDDIFDDGSDYSLDFDDLHGSDDGLYDDDEEYDLEEYEHALPEDFMPQLEIDILHGYFSL